MKVRLVNHNNVNRSHVFMEGDEWTINVKTKILTILDKDGKPCRYQRDNFYYGKIELDYVLGEFYSFKNTLVQILHLHGFQIEVIESSLDIYKFKIVKEI